MNEKFIPLLVSEELCLRYEIMDHTWVDKDSNQVISREEAAERCGVKTEVLAEWEREIDKWLLKELTELLAKGNLWYLGRYER